MHKSATVKNNNSLRNPKRLRNQNLSFSTGFRTVFDTAANIQNAIVKNALVLQILIARPGAHVHQITLSIASGERNNATKFTPPMHAAKLALPFGKKGGIWDGCAARDV